MGLKYYEHPVVADSILRRVSQQLLAARGIRIGTREIVDAKGRVVGTAETASFSNPVPAKKKPVRDHKGRITGYEEVASGFALKD